MMTLFITLIIILGINFHFNPKLDFLKNGDILLWYNHSRKNKERKYVRIYKENKNF